MSFEPADLHAALASIEALPEPSRESARGAVSRVVDLHGEGLRRLLELVRRAAPENAERFLSEAANDELVAGLLLLHGLHPVPLRARVETAIERARALERTAHAELVSIDASSIRVRVWGSDRFRRALTQNLEDAAPDVERVEAIAGDPSFVPLAKLTASRSSEHERCDLCTAPLLAEHEHVFDVRRRKLSCACTGCAVLFERTGSTMRRVRTYVRRVDDFRISDAQWKALEVPVGVAFFYRSSALDRVVAVYPGTLGAVESSVPDAAWQSLCALNPVLAELEQDTSALFVDRANLPASYRLVSIDSCYRLIALVRQSSEGITGSAKAARVIAEFFAERQEACV